MEGFSFGGSSPSSVAFFVEVKKFLYGSLSGGRINKGLPTDAHCLEQPLYPPKVMVIKCFFKTTHVLFGGSENDLKFFEGKEMLSYLQCRKKHQIS